MVGWLVGWLYLTPGAEPTASSSWFILVQSKAEVRWTLVSASRRNAMIYIRQWTHIEPRCINLRVCLWHPMLYLGEPQRDPLLPPSGPRQIRRCEGDT